jgi:hypothetical protein
MLFAVISDVVWQALIAAVVTIFLAWRQERMKQSVDNAAKIGEMTHDLCNSAMLEQKHLLAETTAATAAATNNPADIKAAEVARQSYLDHKQKQDDVTARKDEPAKQAKDL